jgi:hypothetical protein
MKALFTTITVAILLINATTSLAQNTFKRNDLYFELLGNGVVASINYERQLADQPGLGVRVGVGFSPTEHGVLSVPLGFNYLVPFKNQRSFLELGLGVTLTAEPVRLLDFSGDVYDNGTYGNFIPSVAYRAHTSKNLMWRFSLTPMFNSAETLPWVGFSIGKRF